MRETKLTLIEGAVVEEDVDLTLFELCQACRAAEDYVQAWVVEGVLEPAGDSPQTWRFSGESLRRAQLALRLTRDLEINAPGVALALDLLDEIAALRARLRRSGMT
jgi:chaperone modulatory protein CbpM